MFWFKTAKFTYFLIEKEQVIKNKKTTNLEKVNKNKKAAS